MAYSPVLSESPQPRSVSAITRVDGANSDGRGVVSRERWRERHARQQAADSGLHCIRDSGFTVKLRMRAGISCRPAVNESLVPGMISDQDFHESRKPWINKAHGVSPLRPATPPVGHRESKKLVHDMLVHRTSIVTCRSMPRLPVGCCFPEAHSSSGKKPCPPVSYANQSTLFANT